jgi:hypothetical protein
MAVSRGQGQVAPEDMRMRVYAELFWRHVRIPRSRIQRHAGFFDDRSPALSIMFHQLAQFGR